VQDQIRHNPPGSQRRNKQGKVREEKQGEKSMQRSADWEDRENKEITGNKRTEKRRKIIDIFRGLHRERHLESTKTNTKDVPVHRRGSARFKLVS
jgi:hypothetical protein